jgi:hypothetical protein
VDTLQTLLTSEAGTALLSVLVAAVAAAVAVPHIYRLTLCWRLCRARREWRRERRELVAMLDKAMGDATSRLDEFQRQLEEIRDD